MENIDAENMTYSNTNENLAEGDEVGFFYPYRI